MKRKSILKDLARNYLKHTKSESGITLIALVVTIVVLLILAGVTISLVLGENGILTQAKITKFKNEQSDVLEATQLYAGDYEIEKNIQETNGTIINYLNEKNIIDSNNIINVEALLKKKLSTGQGTGNSDVYVIEQNSDKEYIVVYYDKEGNKTELGIVGKEVEEVTDENIFDIDNEGRVSIREEYGSYETNWDKWTIKDLVIPDTINGKKVTKIGENFIAKNEIVKSIKLPEEVTNIEKQAFAGCSSLQDIYIPEGVTDIGQLAFTSCTSLQEIDIPKGVTNIGDGAFGLCISLKNINLPEGVTNLAVDTFMLCVSLESINLPEGITNVAPVSFSLCLSLESINVADNNPNYSSEDGVLFNKTGSELIAFPQGKDINTYEIPNKVNTIKTAAFLLMTNEAIDEFYQIFEDIIGDTDINIESPMLNKVVIPNTVTTVEENAFGGGNAEQTIKVPFSSESTRPVGWNENWKKDCKASIEYTE